MSMTVSSNVLVCKETVLSAVTVVVAHRSAEGVQTKLSFQALAVPWDWYGIFVILGVFMTQLKFYNCHVKRSEI